MQTFDGQAKDRTSIHPKGRPRATTARKRANNLANHQERAEVNRLRAFNLRNPTWHGIGRHAGVRRGH